MQIGRDGIEDDDCPLQIPNNHSYLAEEKQNKEKGVFRIVQKDFSQTPSPTVFNNQAGCSQGINSNNEYKYVDIEYSRTEAERTIQKKVYKDILNVNPSYQWNDFPQQKVIRDSNQQQIDRLNPQKPYILNRKQQLLNSSFDTQQYAKKTNNFLNMEISNLPKKPLKKKMNDKRNRANQSLNESPVTGKNSQQNNSSMQQSQYNNLRDVNKTISVNQIVNGNTSSNSPSTAIASTGFNNKINIEQQANGIKNFQKYLEPNNFKKKSNYQDVSEFPQINISNKNSQSHFEKILKSKPSIPDRISPKILQENLLSTNSTRLNVRRKSSVVSKVISQKIEDSFFSVRRDTSHQNSKENGFRGMLSDESGDEQPSFEGRYKQKQSNSLRQKIKFQKQNNGGGYKIYGEKEDIIFKTGLIANQKQIGSYSENSSPTYNVQTANINYRSNIGHQQSFNQQAPTISYIGTNKTHTKVKLEELKNVQIKQQINLNISNLLKNNSKEQIKSTHPEKVENQNLSQDQILPSTEKPLKSNRKISNKEQEMILEDENDATLTINEDDIKQKVSQQIPQNSEEQKIHTQSFQIIQNKNLQEDLESWKEQECNNIEHKQNNQVQDQLKDNKMESFENLPKLKNTVYDQKANEKVINESKRLESSSLKQSVQSQVFCKNEYIKDNNFQENYAELSNVTPCQTFKLLKEHDSDELPQQQIIDPKYFASDFDKGKIYQNQINLFPKNNNNCLNESNSNVFEKDHSLKQNHIILDNITTNQLNQVKDNSVDLDDLNQTKFEQNENQIEQNFINHHNTYGMIQENLQIINKEKQQDQTEENPQIFNEDRLLDLYEENFEELDEDEQQDLNEQKAQNKQEDKQNILDKQEQIKQQNTVEEKQQDNSNGNKSQYINNKDIFQIDAIQKQSDCSQSVNFQQASEDDDILNKIDLQAIILWEQQISEISNCFKSQNATKCYNSVVNFCSQYLILMRSRNFDNIKEIFTDTKAKKTIHNQMIIERLGIIVLLHNYLDRKFFMNNINNIRNIASQIHLNFVLFIDLVVQKIAQSHPQLINNNDHSNLDQQGNQIKYPESLINLISFVKDIACQNIYRKKTNKASEFIQAIKQNNEILLNLFRNITKHDKDFYNHIQIISKKIEKTNSVEETFIYILNTFALYLTILENVIGFQPLPFLAVCPAPYLPPLQTIEQINNKNKKIEFENVKNGREQGDLSSENTKDGEDTRQETATKEDKTSKELDFNAQNYNKKTNKLPQKEQTNIGRLKSLSKQQYKSNNGNIKKNTAPISQALNNSKNGTNQEKNIRRPSPPPIVGSGQNRRKSLSNNNSVNIIKNNNDEKFTPEKFREYTLVLDLDETLVHYSESNGGGQFVVRPFAPQFLQEISEYYEIIVFTAAMPDYANWVLDNIDPNKLISHRLFRQHAVHIGNVFIKDLSRLGRSLEKTIIIDNVADNFQLQPENGIFIKGWFSDPHDTALSELLPLLKEMVSKKVPDVRRALKNLKEQMIQNIQNGVEFPHLNLKLD